MSEPNEALEQERAAVKAAHASAEVYASPPEQERSLAWHLGRRLLRVGLLWLLLVLTFVGMWFVWGKR